MDIETLKAMSKSECLDFIRLILIKDGAKTLKDHHRFEMSGYESKPGQCTLHNQFVLNKFAFLGLYDYTSFLSLDFYKGTPTVYFEYFWDNEITQSVNYSGMGTCEIIYDILLLTVLSQKSTRRRS